MLRDDAIRAGLIIPTEEDRKRMNLPDDYIVKPEQIFDETEEILEELEESINETGLLSLNYLELKEKAKGLNIKLPKKYISKADLIELIENNLT